MSEEKKIIIDEDWKSQVEREKEVIEEQANNPDEQPAGSGEIPPASFPMLITSIGTQAMMALGQVPDPMSGKAIYSPDLARHHIDTLVMLQEKTQGNLDDDEQQMIENFINELRRVFIAMQNANFEIGGGADSQIAT
jgi:hypothetical protein